MKGAVAAGHPCPATAGARVLEQGRNAGAAVGIAAGGKLEAAGDPRRGGHGVVVA